MTDYTWNGLVSTDASVANNWTPSGIPTTGDKAIFDATGAQPCNFNIPALDEIEIQSDNINLITFSIDVDLIGLSVSAAGTMAATASRVMTFSGTPLYKSGSCYIEIGTSSSPFNDVISREHFTFTLTPSTGNIYFDTGIYPNITLGGSGGNFTPQYVAPTVADSTDVHFLIMVITTSGTFGPASATPTDNDKAKNFILDSSTSQFTIAASSITDFDGGYATWTFQGATAGFLIPTSNLADYQGCDFTFQKMSIVATDAGAGSWAKIAANARLYLTDFTVGVGVSVKGAGASAIHLINRPTIKGTWGFFPIADGIYHHKDGEVLGVANGGTGLANVGEYEIPFGTDGNALTTSSRLTFDNNLNELTIDGKLTVSGLIDPTGLELTPVAANPGGVAANTLWLDSTNSNKLTLGSTEVGSGGGGGGGGTVSSVDMSVPTGFTISGNPITGTGTLALAFDTGYALPTSAKQTQWDTAYGWGDHSTQGYLTSSPPETDPVFSVHPASGITVAGGGDVSKGETAFGWGDHGAAGYLTSFTEADPVFTASEANLFIVGDAAKLAGIEANAQVNVPLQHMRLYGINTGSNLHTVSSGSRVYLDLGDATKFAESTTGSHPDITITNAATDYITIAAGGIYQITGHVGLFPATAPSSHDVWVEYNTNTSANRELGVSRVQHASNSTGNMNYKHSTVVEVPSTASDMNIYISVFTNGATVNVRAYDNNRFFFTITRIGDSTV